MKKYERLITVIGLVMSLGSISVLEAIALKRNKDAYEAEQLCTALEMSNSVKDLRINVLEKEVEELKQKYENKEES